MRTLKTEHGEQIRYEFKELTPEAKKKALRLITNSLKKDRFMWKAYFENAKAIGLIIMDITLEPYKCAIGEFNKDAEYTVKRILQGYAPAMGIPEGEKLQLLANSFKKGLEEKFKEELLDFFSSCFQDDIDQLTKEAGIETNPNARKAKPYEYSETGGIYFD